MVVENHSYRVVAYIHHEYEKSCSPSNGQMIDFPVLPLDLLLKIGFLHSLWVMLQSNHPKVVDICVFT